MGSKGATPQPSPGFLVPVIPEPFKDGFHGAADAPLLGGAIILAGSSSSLRASFRSRCRGAALRWWLRVRAPDLRSCKLQRLGTLSTQQPAPPLWALALLGTAHAHLPAQMSAENVLELRRSWRREELQAQHSVRELASP